MNDERKLRKCGACGECFNTTDHIMMQHYRLKHFESHWKEAIKTVDFTVRLMSDAFKAAVDAMGHFSK